MTFVPRQSAMLQLYAMFSTYLPFGMVAALTEVTGVPAVSVIVVTTETTAGPAASAAASGTRLKPSASDTAAAP